MTWVALHGFTQRGTMWDEAAALAGGEWVTPDLPGHGGRAACPWEEAVRIVADLLGEAPPPRCLVGYSMGGRLALAVALDHPGLVDRLALLSAAPGIADPEVRRRRAEEDRALAEHIEEAGVAAFLDEWLDQPWFGGGQTPSAEWRAAERAARMGSTAAGLAGALRLLGQGAQPALGERLGELRVPVLLVAGADDERYAALARSMGEQIRHAEVALVARAGHALVGERPREVAARLGAWGARR
jgi:2-succinyl-6-hydroxy-2,4-cyclohexadiene-1-carboxylate synthase